MKEKELTNIWTDYTLYSLFRRLNTLNKCAIMKIGTPTKKEVRLYFMFLYYTTTTHCFGIQSRICVGERIVLYSNKNDHFCA